MKSSGMVIIKLFENTWFIMIYWSFSQLLCASSARNYFVIQILVIR